MGPFVSEGGDFFSVTAGDAAAAWTGIPHLSQQASSSSEVEIIVRDFRARFADLNRSAEELHVICDGSLSISIYLHAYVEDYEGSILRLREQVVGGRATLALPRVLKEVQLFLLTQDGECLDDYAERESDRSHRFALLLAPRPEAVFSHELTEALVSGENETTEFKEWIPLSRTEAKAAELMRVVCAFSNTAGGSLFIGVSDDLEIVGVNRQLITLVTDPSSSLGPQRDLYVQELRRILNDALTPSVAATLDWINLAGQWVLRIRVEPETQGITTIIQSNEAFVRRGASNRRLGPTELADLLARRPRT